MTEAIVRSETPEESEYARYLGEIETRKERVATLRADIESLKETLSRFEAEYHARVGTRFLELDRVQLAIEEYERRILLLRATPDLSPDEAEREVQQTFEAQRANIADEEETTRRYEEAFEHEQTRPELETVEATELKRLYRDLAKRFHPDLARTEMERGRRAAVMQQINQAFQDRNLAALRGLGQASEYDDPAFQMRSIGEKLVWAIREVARLDELARALEDEMIVITRTPTYQLWQRVDAGEAAVERMVQEIDRDVGIAQSRLEALIETYRGLLEVRSS
jgi:hypothetical protein